MLRLALVALVALALSALVYFLGPWLLEETGTREPPADKETQKQKSRSSGIAHRTTPVEKPKPAFRLPYQQATEPQMKASLPEKKPPLQRYYRVVAEDAGTLKAGKTMIRLADVAPLKLDETCTDKSGERWPCGRRGRAAVRRLIRSRAVNCSVVSRTGDSEMVARCSVGRVDLSDWVVRHGWARPERGARERYAEALDTARKGARGLWRSVR